MSYEKPTLKTLVTISAVLLIASAAFGYSYKSRNCGKDTTAQTYPPGILFSTVLDNITINANGGWIKNGTNMVAVFLPENAKGRMVLNDGAGNEICHWDWAATRGRFNAPFQTINFRNAMAPSGNQFDASNLKLTKPGNYVFDFYAAGKKFYTFPVSIRELQPSNPFGGESKYLVDGAWNDWGYIYIPDVAPDSNVAWKLWLREWEFEQKSRSIEVELVRDAGKMLVAENKTITSSTFRHDWKRQDFQLYKPKDHSLFKGRDLLPKPGGYTLTMKMSGKVYGVWKFEVKAGKLVTKGRAARGSADPLTFVEGGMDAFWYRKS